MFAHVHCFSHVHWCFTHSQLFSWIFKHVHLFSLMFTDVHWCSLFLFHLHYFCNTFNNVQWFICSARIFVDFHWFCEFSLISCVCYTCLLIFITCHLCYALACFCCVHRCSLFVQFAWVLRPPVLLLGWIWWFILWWLWIILWLFCFHCAWVIILIMIINNNIMIRITVIIFTTHKT